MRNFLPIGLFAAAASLTIFGSPSLQPDHVAARSNAFAMPNAMERSVLRPEADSRLSERDDMRFFVPRCDRQSPCAVRRPMT